MRAALGCRLGVALLGAMTSVIAQPLDSNPTKKNESEPEARVAPSGRVPRLTIDGCSTLDASKLEQLFTIELSVLGEIRSDAGAFLLEVRCPGKQVELRLFDPNEMELLARSMAFPKTEPEREVALASAELLMALNWIPRLAPSGGPTGGLALPTGRQPPPPLLSPEENQWSKTGWTILAGGALAARSLDSSSFVMGGATLTGEYHFVSPLYVAAAASFEEGSTLRRAGEITATAWTLGALAGAEVEFTPHLSLTASLGVRATMARLAGASRSSSVGVAQLNGVVPELLVRAGPRGQWGWFVLAPYGLVGLTLSDWEARVSNENPVRFSAFWVGGGLEVGFNVGGGR